LVDLVVSAHPFAMRSLTSNAIVTFFFDTSSSASIAIYRVPIVALLPRVYHPVSTKLRGTNRAFSFNLSAGIPRLDLALAGAAVIVYQISIVALLFIPRGKAGIATTDHG